jgi:FkbH-like protein
MNLQEIRQEIDRLIGEGNAAAASIALRELWTNEKSPAAAAFVVSRFERLRPQLGLLPYRVAVLRSFTVEPMVPLFRATAFIGGFDLSVHLSDFNAYPQEILDPGSSLYRFKPDAAILAVQSRDLAPELWNEFGDLDLGQIRAASSRVATDFGQLISTFRKNCAAHLLVHNLEQPCFPANGILDAQRGHSQRSIFEQMNQGLRKIAEEHTGVFILDYDALVARHGRGNWHDEQKWLTVRFPLAGPSMNHLVDEWMRFMYPLAGKIAKCLVVDLDNTLWGGVIGEDGMDDIRLGPEYPGAAYQELQRALLDLHRRGILLAICSKNNPDDAWEVLNHHAGMKLQPRHFSATRINWAEKSENLREIAAELNIGLDSLAFLDDSPSERRQVRSALPEVWVVDLPDDPMRFARMARECPLFERLSLSAEDRQRSEIYHTQRAREQLQRETVSREDFFRSLQQEAEIVPVSKATLARVAQLTNKTNQFNLTARRFSEQEIVDLCASAGWSCFSLRVQDRFGDNGLVGVAITHCEADTCEIDTFLMSCRVIGRTLETAFLSFLASHAGAQGACRLRGWFRPTKKNQPARDFYLNHGFAMEVQEDDATLWTLDLGKNMLSCPDWIRLRILNGETK